MKRKTEFKTIVMMLSGLVAIILIYYQFQQIQVATPPELKSRPPGLRVGVSDSVYYHMPFRFTQRLPSPKWEMRALATDSVLVLVQPEKPLFEQITWLVQLTRPAENDSVRARVGILQWRDSINARGVTIQLLDEWIKKHEQNDRVEILQPVESPAHHLLKGWYVVFTYRRSAYILSVLPRYEFTYVLLIESSVSAYPKLRSELKKVVSRFRPLPSVFY